MQERRFLDDHSIHNEKVESWNDSSLNRLQRVMQGDLTSSMLNQDSHFSERDSDSTIVVKSVTFQSEFNAFKRSNNFWNKDCVLFWTNYTHLNDFMVILCYMHAPVVLQYYDWY